MVLLTMTAMIVEVLVEVEGLRTLMGSNMIVEEVSVPGQKKVAVEALSAIKDGGGEQKPAKERVGVDGFSSPGEINAADDQEPPLSNPTIGNPISHGQVIDLWRELKSRGSNPKTLDTLLRGARVYIPPPKPKPEPTSEYKALMARLRREEEARSYQRMTNPAPPMETFAQRFPLSSAAHAFASSQQPPADEEDEVTYADVDRQMTLILNVLVSIVACAVAIWVVARWWSTPARLALSMSGSLLVGVAEVVVYSGYIRRVSEAKGKEKRVKEVKEVVKTWVVGGGDEKEETKADIPIKIEGSKSLQDTGARQRKKGA